MARFVIEGPAKLKGKIKVSGTKNEALKLIAFSIMLQKPIVLENTPNILDVTKQLEIFDSMGGLHRLKYHKLYLDSTKLSKTRLASTVARKLRASIVFIGPLLARFGKVTFPLPGGCLIGARPIDTHTDAFKQLGAQVEEKNLLLTIKLEKPLTNKVVLKEQSVTATENVVMYCAGVEQEITIQNCAVEPEIVHLCEIVKKAGAKVEGIGTKKIKIRGSKNLKINRVKILSDRIEAATFVIALLATKSEGVVYPYPKENLVPFNELLRKTGANVSFKGEKAYVGKFKPLKPFKITTAVHPGFPTDLQSPTSLLALIANGISEINETMYENRLIYLNLLEKMGMKVRLLDNHHATITGPGQLKATKITSLDLRSGITMIIAGLMAEGKTIVENGQIIDRGYEHIEQKLTKLGANIKRMR